MPLYHLHACHRKSWRLCGMRQWPCGPAQARKSPAMLSKPAMQHSARRHPAAAIITKTIRRRAYFQLSDTCRYFWKRWNHRHRQSVQRLFRHLESGGHSGRGYSPFIQCSRRSFPEIGSAASFANHPYRYGKWIQNKRPASNYKRFRDRVTLQKHFVNRYKTRFITPQSRGNIWKSIASQYGQIICNSPKRGHLVSIMFRYFCYLYLVLPVAGNADIHNTGKCLALFSGNESDNSKQVENKLISLRLKQAWAVAYLYLWALSEPVTLIPHLNQ